ncbi:hypothetical protein O6H91_16G030200 [Diphasiastrum complanatum]|uniref:Uncharacterized protein n=1 Tax=Diphasiastrum complanatum TaxID=34168 RepID=A0ACC2BB24_DIPCM|nr:hypothetical protein O6H91_16G030200 [Diphasiastrum complanatum]
MCVHAGMLGNMGADQFCNVAPVVVHPLYPAISPTIYPPVAIEEELVRVFCKAAPEFYLTGYEDGTVAMAPINVSDPRQKWVKDKSWGSKLEDAAGFPAFALINKATGRALRHGHSECDQVDSIHFKQNEFEDDILWSTSQDFGQRYRTIRMYNNIALNLDIDHRAKKLGDIKQGTRLILYRWLKDRDHQYWRIVPV